MRDGVWTIDSRETKSRRTERAFTLIELVVTVAIVTILAMIAIPQYEQFVLRSNRTAIQSYMEELRGQQEAYALQHRGSYATSLQPLTGFSGDIFIDTGGNETGSQTGASKFRVRMTNATTTGFLLEGVPLGRQSDDTDCQSYYLASDGRAWANSSDFSTALAAEDKGCWGR